MALTPDKMFVLAVALLTWGGVFGYLLRLDKLAKSLEAEVKLRETETEIKTETERVGGQ
ncbi:MAG TPA: hypothetical protein VGB45_04115 [Abditibacterium sp.]|jgi:hypothetical protein